MHSIDDVVEACKKFVSQIEKEWGCYIALDKRAFAEAYAKAEETLANTKIQSPNEVKLSGHYAFWIRKIKPFQLITTDHVVKIVDDMNERGLVSGTVKQESIEDPKYKHRYHYINEMIALLYTIGICRSTGHSIKLKKKTVHDLAVSLRYNSFSPSAITAILDAHLDQ